MRKQRGWLPALALMLVALGLPAAVRATATGQRTVVGKITGVPMGTQIMLSSTGRLDSTTVAVDLSAAKISERGKALRRYDLAEGMKVRVKGTMRRNSLRAQTVEVLERPTPRKPAGPGKGAKRERR